MTVTSFQNVGDFDQEKGQIWLIFDKIKECLACYLRHLYEKNCS